MLWNKRKPSESVWTAVAAPDRSGLRAADPDRALDALGRLLESYGRFAFDTELTVAALREQCAAWAQRIVLGEPRRETAEAAPEAAAPERVVRDWHGLYRFFDDRRKAEGEYVVRSLGELRHAVYSLARSLGSSAAQDQSSDAEVERRLDVLARALGQPDMMQVRDAAGAVIQTTRAAFAQRREREARHVVELGQQVQKLRQELSDDCKNAGTDELTGLFSRVAYEQHQDQLATIGLLLEEPPWLVLIELDDDKGKGRRGSENDRLHEVSKCASRTFLRKQDFLARSGSTELAALLVEMTEPQLATALDRLLDGVRKLSPESRRGSSLTVSIGAARLRPDDEAQSWRARAEVALRRVKQAGGDDREIKGR
jgi:diguanylate cyclase (GGDEF)-like protein